MLLLGFRGLLLPVGSSSLFLALGVGLRGFVLNFFRLGEEFEDGLGCHPVFFRLEWVRLEWVRLEWVRLEWVRLDSISTIKRLLVGGA